ncbi:MAG: dephospho-CoA kinase [Candidatus Nitrosoglobus sp.]
MPIYKIGLTGGIGSGKSTAARIFSELDVPIIDADIIARELVEPEQPALAEIVAIFGRGVLNAKGALDRARLHYLVFGNERLRTRLESILHPRIIQEMHCQAARLTATALYCVLVIPLLLETAQEYSVNRILVIDVPDTIQRHRIKIRDGFSDTKIDAILRTQCPRALRLAAADDSIINNADLATMRHQIKCYHQEYLSLASQHLPSAPT